MSDAAAASAQPFSPKAVVWMIMVGVFAFAAFVVLSAYAPDLRSGRDGRAHALSKSAVGYAGIVALAKGTGIPVVVSRGGAAGSSLLVLTPEPGVSAKALQSILQETRHRPVLLILPKWQVAPTLGHPGWVSQAGLVPPKAVVPALPPSNAPLVIARRRGTAAASLTDIESGRAPFDIGAVASLQTARSDGWTPALIDAAGDWVVIRSKAQPNLLVVADPDLFNTQGLKDLRRARMALSILEDLRGDGPVVFDVSLNGFQRSRGVLKLAFEPPFLAATLCALAAAILMGLHAAARFGAPHAPERALALGKRALADNSAALLRLAKREPSMAQPYADLTRQAVARAVGAPRLLDKTELDAVLDRLAAKAGRPAEAASLSAEASKVSDIGGLMAVARKLYDFRRGMTRERD